MKTEVLHTFSPFGPVLPGSPGGPYAIKIKREKSPHQPEAGRVRGGPGCPGPSVGSSRCRLRGPSMAGRTLRPVQARPILLPGTLFLLSLGCFQHHC